MTITLVTLKAVETNEKPKGRGKAKAKAVA